MATDQRDRHGDHPDDRQAQGGIEHHRSVDAMQQRPDHYGAEENEGHGLEQLTAVDDQLGQGGTSRRLNQPKTSPPAKAAMNPLPPSGAANP